MNPLIAALNDMGSAEEIFALSPGLLPWGEGWRETRSGASCQSVNEGESHDFQRS